MPARKRVDVLIVDQSQLAQNMYRLLFSAQAQYRVHFGEEFETLFKRSVRLRPDLLIVNSNSLAKWMEPRFPCPTILIASRDRLDLKEGVDGRKDMVLIEKPFYPYDLLSVANRLSQQGRRPRGRPPGRRPVGQRPVGPRNGRRRRRR